MLKCKYMTHQTKWKIFELHDPCTTADVCEDLFTETIMELHSISVPASTVLQFGIVTACNFAFILSIYISATF